jgi:peptide/nickel transport system substrate-binding protein
MSIVLNKRLLIFISLTVMLLSLAACATPTASPTSAPPTSAPQAAQPTTVSPTTAPPAATKAPVTFVKCMSGDPVKLDPADFDDGNSAHASEQVFETLVEFDGATTKLKPALAEKWSTSADSLTWTFNLRKGVKFSDGSPLTADDVLFAFTRQWDDSASNAAHNKVSLSWEYWHDVLGFGFKSEKTALVKDIKKVDDSTIQFTLSQPNAAFLLNIAIFSNAIYKPAGFTAAPDKFGTPDSIKNLIGTGPFMFNEWVKDDHVTLVKNPNWWGDPSTLKIDRAIIRAVKDNSQRYLATKAGECSGMEFPSTDDATAAAKEANLQVLKRPSLNIAYLAYNQNIKPFDKLEVRQAVAYAINKQAIIDALYAGQGIAATQFLPPTMDVNGVGVWNKDIPNVCCDAQKAKDLLTKAGVTNLTFDLWYMPVSRPYYPDPKAIATAYASDLAKAGITANLKTEDWGQYKTDALAGKFAVWLLGWTGDNGDPDNFLFTFFGDDPLGSGVSSKREGYASKPLNDLLKKALAEIDANKRADMYKQAAKIISDDFPFNPIAHTTPPLIFSKKVSGYVPNPTGTEFFKTVSISQ